MRIKVYNNGQLVHNGTLEEFLTDNQYDEWLINECNKLKTQFKIEFCCFSGHWVIERV